jgi:hypothetical protein
VDAVTKDLISGDKGKLAGSGLGNGHFLGTGLRDFTSPLPLRLLMFLETRTVRGASPNR